MTSSVRLAGAPIDPKEARVSDLEIAERLARLREWHERTTSACADWKTRQDVVDAIGLPYADTLWGQIENSRTVLRLVAALEAVVAEIGEKDDAVRLAASLGFMDPADVELVAHMASKIPERIAAALFQDTEETQ